MLGRACTRTASVLTRCLACSAPHRRVDAHLGRGCGWHASCHSQVHDSNRSSSRDRPRTDSRVLLPRVSFATVRPRSHRGDSFYPLGVGMLTLPPPSPPHAGRWAVSASRWNRSSSSALTSGWRRLELATARRAPLMTSPDTDGSTARFVREFERTLGSSCRWERRSFVPAFQRPVMPGASVTGIGTAEAVI